MAECCRPPRGYEKLFGRRAARRDAKRYRRKGLDETAEGIVEFLRTRGVTGQRILDIGGGVGTIDIELVKAGAEHAVDVELSPDYEDVARELWRETGVADRIEFRVDDVAADGRGIGPADAVVMHRVVCCYPDPDALVGAAADLARRYLVMTFPRERLFVRVGLTAINVVARLLRWEYRSYVHPVDEILAPAARRGFTPAFERSGAIWQLAALERA
jgi:2-polyprenyl-3-methyl-5-hydroxy-6-metoxy-1,4-benzoquinol methylase